ncbi:MAG: glycosyltransferase [Anaerolineales bacterium]|nr:MAG: glycosyltransferase [Anaerolineales bacterium]
MSPRSYDELKKRSVLVVTNMYPDEQNPDFGTFVQEQVVGLRGRGLDVDVLVVGGKRRKSSYIEGARRFRTRLRQRRYDLIHAHYVFSGIVARLQHRYPLLVSFHGAAEMVGWVGWLCKALAPLADAVTVTSESHKLQLGHPNARVVPCGVDLDLFVPMPRGQARQRLGLPPQKKLVLFVGIVRPEKRLDVIQAAVEILRREDEDVELAVVTAQPHQRIPLYMNACDVFALASDYEGSPVVIKEAMACNLPIVSVSVGDVKQVIGETQGCYICQRDPADMAQKLRLALSRGRRTDGRRVIQRLGLDTTLDSLLRIYEDLW